MKTKLKGTYRKRGRTTFIRGPTKASQCTGFQEPASNSDLAGVLVKPPVFAAEQNECCSACAAIPECEGFSYFEDFCYLKGKVQGTYAKNGCTVLLKGSVRRLTSESHSFLV